MLKRLLVSAAFLMAATPAFAAQLQVLEFAGEAIVQQGARTNIPPMPPLVEQTPVDFTAGATSSAAFNAQTKFVILRCDVQCSVKFGAPAQTATTNNIKLQALVHYRLGATPGHVVSVIASP